MHLWQVSVHQPFFSLSLLKSYPPTKKNIMSVTFNSSSIILTKLRQKMTMNATFIVIF
jgi:hypothetical protein